MANLDQTRSISLVSLFITSFISVLLIPAHTVMASNETTFGPITGTEIWSGNHDLTGDVTVASGAKLIIEPGTTVTFPNGTHLDVRGSICVGQASCGSSSNANSAQRIIFEWSDPTNGSAIGECYGISQGNQEIYVDDPSCFEGVLISNSIDLSETGFQHLTFESPWGIPYYVSAINEFRYAALVVDGASPTFNNLEFNDVNTSSVLTTNLAQPKFIGGEFIVGSDGEGDVIGSALQIYSSGSSINPFQLKDITLSGTNNGCQPQDDGRPTIWIEQSFVEIENAEIESGDFGISLRNSAGSVSDSNINVNCNGIDITSKISVGSVDFDFNIFNNEISSIQGSGITVYAGGKATLEGNSIESQSGGSGIVVSSSTVQINDNEIGPIGEWNGLWLIGSYDVTAENNTISETAREPIVAGRYTRSEYAASRLYLANNSITYSGTGACYSLTHWGGEFTCPAIHTFRTGVTMYDNQIDIGMAGDADGIMAIGSILDIQRNTFNVPNTGAIIKHFDTGFAADQQYGSIAFFSQNSWNGVEETYNISNSYVTVQSEYIPTPTNADFPIKLSWIGQEARPQNNFQNAIIPTEIKNCLTCVNLTPRNFPLAVSMDHNSTIFNFANLSNSFSLSNVKIATLPTKYAVQVSRAELVRFQTLINGERVIDSLVLVEDALGNDLYTLRTQSNGFTPWVALSSNFHLDFRGLDGGNNPDGFADDEYEDSCSDGRDNDGDLVIDSQDSDCNTALGTREMSLYRFTAYKFGFGYYRGEFTLEENSMEEIVNLENLPPSVLIDQNSGQSFKKYVNISGSAYDGILDLTYDSDSAAQWGQRGYVHSVQIKYPGINSWEEAALAIDSSGMEEGQVTRFNRPFGSWYFSVDLSHLPDGDYDFQFRAYDGIEYSQIVNRSFKVNSQPPTVLVTSPAPFSTHDDGKVLFTGNYQDYYGCSEECNKDVSEIWFEIQKPNGGNTQSAIQTNGDGTWQWEWDFTGEPRDVAPYTFNIWAADSDFCTQGSSEECSPTSLTLSIDNSNSQPTIYVEQPIEGDIISVSNGINISGIARDFDGSITKIEIYIYDINNDNNEVYYTTATDFTVSSDGEMEEWTKFWDIPENYLRHNAAYSISSRSFDGTNYSSWSEVMFIAYDPPFSGQSPPEFNQELWQEEIILYCDIDSTSTNRCTTANIDLNQYFSDIDNDLDYFTIVNDPTTNTDDIYPIVFEVGQDGIARYDPFINMNYYDEDINTWSLYNVVFQAHDTSQGRALSSPINVIVEPIIFNISSPELNWVDDDEIAIFSGVGLPGKQVTVFIAGVEVNYTIVSEDGTWQLGIPASRIEGESSIPQFRYTGQEFTGTKIFLGEPVEESTNWGMYAFIAVSIIAALSLFAYFFIEIENEDEDQHMAPTTLDEEDSEDPYAWAKVSEEVPEWAMNSEEDSNQLYEDQEKLTTYDEHPGWLWDAKNEEWVPDPNFSEENT